MRTTTWLTLIMALSAAAVNAQTPLPKPPKQRAPTLIVPAPARTPMQPAPAAPGIGLPVTAFVPVAPMPPTTMVTPRPAPAPMPAPTPAPAHAPMPAPPVAVGQDPADVLWNQARAEMNRQNYTRASELFQRLIQRHRTSEHVPNAYYWAAFSLYKRNATSNLQEAKRLLEVQKREHPRAGTRTESETLLVRINGELASRGDAESALAVTKSATQAATQPCPDREDEEVRAAALNALMRMGSDNAMPLLRQIMQRRDACSAELRRNAVYMITRQESPEREKLLLEAVRSDPDPEVKKNAVFWMSRSRSEEALEAIHEVLRSTNDHEVQQVAVHALSQHSSPRASQVLRELAGSSNVNREVRQAAVHWLGQKDDAANGPFLRSLFNRVDDVQVKEAILHIMSRRNDHGNSAWLLSIAQDAKQADQLRKAALYWASQGNIQTTDIARLYDSMPDAEMKQQILYSLSRRTKDAAAIDKLIDIAKNDRDPSMRKNAIFWLGQSKDPRAIRALQQIAGS